MGGLIGGMFGGGDDGGSTSTSTTASDQLGQNRNQLLSYQDPNSPVASFQQQFVRNDGQPQQQTGQSLSNMYRNNQQQNNQNNYMAKRGGLWSFFGG